MKKGLILTFLISLVTLTANAQFEKDKWFINSSITGLGLSYSGTEKARFGFDAEAGSFMADNIALLINIGGDYGKHITNNTHVGVGGRYYFDRVGIFLGLGLKYKRFGEEAYHRNDLGATLEVGYAFFLSRTVTLEPAVYYDQSFLHHTDFSKMGLKVGFGFYF